jgi:hypothetical protein
MVQVGREFSGATCNRLNAALVCSAVMNPYAAFLGTKDPLKVLSATPGRIATLVRGLSPRQVARKPAPGKWSIHDIVAHLADTEEVMDCRARWIAFEDGATLTPFDQDKWSAGRAREKEPFAEALERFRVVRRSSVRLFRATPRDAWSRQALHPERGPVSLRTQMETAAGHDLNHMAQIEALARDLRRRPK